ncbi:hypothetical protein [Anaerofustis stercorihominis]|uniref:hypothetical protein n=1 Tax=Anaerofustis stercorihominis TaxID=214853 RepID=UPI00214B7D2C|nr:hypothetical protein [Anaerofustis stercorihominis]MCR2032428.1 hypothetical protein [Anaerofustis stercorihominis]
MRRSELVAAFKSDINTVWDVMTNNKDFSWRSDLDRIEILDKENFVEYTKDGFSTSFKITAKEKPHLYKFDMENKNFKGKWIGEFRETEDGGCEITFIEEIYIKSKVMEILSHLFMNLKKMQDTYVRDLKVKLGEDV